MKRINRYKTVLLVLSAVLFLSACDDYLDLSPSNSIPSTSAITSKQTANAAIIGAYNSVQSYYSGYYITLGTITADNVSYNGTLSQYLQLDQNSISPDNAGTIYVYRVIYEAINSANSIIDAIDEVEDPLFTEAEKIRFWVKRILSVPSAILIWQEGGEVYRSS
jgi:hypothetical protein